ncbi:unnamed protein product [Candidula unifasciata]|uniref:Uncharacterized protein n=1 Tax=Candidula unifasciata TaxID=100452 RepID=A0A8S3YGW0_9EUPU|nr:unnamed protein product [Candidula unifasciata]
MGPTRTGQTPCLRRREFASEQLPRHACSVEADRGAKGPDMFWDIRWLKERVKKLLLWKRIEPFLPEWPLTATANGTSDYLVGMTLHCFILSVFVLSVAAARALVVLFRFACYISLHYAIYKGEIIPISEVSAEPVTVDQVREATIFDSSGLKIILVQSTPKISNRPPTPASRSRLTTTKSPPRDSESVSSQDCSNSFSFSSK